MAAVCDESTAVVGVDDCAVRLLTWDTIHLVSISEATWITCVVMLVLLLLLCFSGGAALGWRKAIQRFEHRVVPTMRAPVTPKSANRSPPPGQSPQRLEYADELDRGGQEQESGEYSSSPLRLEPSPEHPSRRATMPLRRNSALEPSRMTGDAPYEPVRMPHEAPYDEPGDLVIVSLDEPPALDATRADMLGRQASPDARSQSLSTPEMSPPPAAVAQAAQEHASLMAQQAALISATRQAAAKLMLRPTGIEEEAQAYQPAFMPQMSVKMPSEIKPLLETTPPELAEPEDEEAVEPAAKAKKGKKEGSEAGAEGGGKKKKKKKAEGDTDGDDGADKKERGEKKKKKKKDTE